MSPEPPSGAMSSEPKPEPTEVKSPDGCLVFARDHLVGLRNEVANGAVCTWTVEDLTFLLDHLIEHYATENR